MIEAKVVGDEGLPVNEPLIVIAYPSTKDNKWRVLVFSYSTDINSAISNAEMKIANPGELEVPIFYRHLGESYASAGRLNDSFLAYKKAAELNRANPVTPTPGYNFHLYFEANADAMAEIIGP